MSVIQSRVRRDSAEFQANAAASAALLDTLKTRLDLAGRGGSEEARERHRGRGKLLVRERITLLLDPGTPFLELSPLAAWEMYDGDVPAAGSDGPRGQAGWGRYVAGVVWELADLGRPPVGIDGVHQSVQVSGGGEEPAAQEKRTARRLNLPNASGVLVYPESSLREVLDRVEKIVPKALIVESIHTVWLPESESYAGSVTQVRDCTQALMEFAKRPCFS